MTIWLASTARRCPHAPALIQGSDRLSYAKLADEASRRAAVLSNLGLGPGDRVMLEAPVTLASALWLHALLWLGAAVVPVAPSLGRDDAEVLSSRLGARALIGSKPSPDARPAGTRGPEGLPVIDAAQSVGRDIAPLPPPAHDPSRLATILLTSGSSSVPKAVPLTLGNHAASIDAIAERLGGRAPDRWLLCLPLEHIGGLAILLRAVKLGDAVVLMRRFDSAGFTLALKQHRITLTSMVPSMLASILASHSHQPPAGLRGAFIGGAPAAPDLLQRARNAAWPVLPTWGMTEASSQLATPAPELAASMDFSTEFPVALPPLPGVEIRTTRSGALEVRGPMLFSGYLDGTPGPDAAGWFTTSDRGDIEPDGSVRIHGRVDSVIISGGVNVELDDVARRLLDCPLIGDAATVGLDDLHWGQRVGAVVVLNGAKSGSSPSTGELDNWTRQHLQPAERPVQWRVVDRIPRSRLGKPLKRTIGMLFE